MVTVLLVYVPEATPVLVKLMVMVLVPDREIPGPATRLTPPPPPGADITPSSEIDRPDPTTKTPDGVATAYSCEE
jgi:hypothetical protein